VIELNQPPTRGLLNERIWWKTTNTTLSEQFQNIIAKS